MSAKTILILSFPEDLHAQAIRARLRQMGADAVIVDTAGFPEHFDLVHHEGASAPTTIAGVALDGCHCVWWRRMRTPRVDDAVRNGDERVLARRECTDALVGALEASGIPILNDPEAERRAGRKLLQLRVARQCGLSVPPTLVSTDPAAVTAFAAAQDDAIVYKSLTGVPFMLADTRPLQIADLDELWRLRFAPAIFQAFIPLGREYRVTLIEERAFVAEIRIQQEAARYDWRIDPTYLTLPAALDAEVLGKLQALRRALGLHSGSIDLRETPDGEIYFLEINVSGQFLFLDAFAGLDTATAFSEMLLRDRPARNPMEPRAAAADAPAAAVELALCANEPPKEQARRAAHGPL